MQNSARQAVQPLVEVLNTGYSGALANPLFASEGSLNRLNSTVLDDFVDAKYISPHMVLVASGVEHEELLKYAEPLLSNMPGGAQVHEPKSDYVGGDPRVMVDTDKLERAYRIQSRGRDGKRKIRAGLDNDQDICFFQGHICRISARCD